MNGLSPKQLKSFKESNAKLNIWEGSVRSGKTYISLWRFIKELIYGPKGEYAILTKTYATFQRNILPLLEFMVGIDARFYIGKSQMHMYGKTIWVIGCDDRDSEKKIKGATLAGAYVDEATEIPESVWIMLKSRCAMGGAKIFATTNPDSPYHWLKKEIDENPDLKSWQFTLHDNPMLTLEEKEYLIRQHKGVWYKRFIEGLWVQAEGAIYDFFDTNIHTIEYPFNQAQYYVVGVDYGTTNPCSFIAVGVNFNKFPNMWVEREYYFDSKVAQRQKTDSEYADDFIRFTANMPVSAIYIDPSAASFKLELQRKGVENLYDAVNEVEDGIRFVSKYVDNGTLKICKQCPNLIKEFQSYVWDKTAQMKGIDKPMKVNDHALDALRYALYSHFFTQETGTHTAKDLDRIYNETRGVQPELPKAFQQPDHYTYRPMIGGF